MKQWTQSYPLAKETVRADEHAAEVRTAKSMAMGLDRTQLGKETISKSRVVDNAFHKVWLFNTDGFNADFPGEQSAHRDEANVIGFHFAGATYGNYDGGWTEIASLTLDGSKEGMGHVEFTGNFQQNVFGNDKDTANPKRLAVRLRIGNETIAETFGFPEAMGSFKVVGMGSLTAGDNELTIDVRYPRKVAAEPVSSGHATYDYEYPQFHFFGCKVLVIGRWR